MPKYRVLEKSFIENKLVEAGAVIDYDGEASSNLEPLSKKEAKAAEEADATGDQAE